MNDVELKREAVKKAYDGPDWGSRVQRMSANQILAIYFRLKKVGRL